MWILRYVATILPLRSRWTLVFAIEPSARRSRIEPAISSIECRRASSPAKASASLSSSACALLRIAASRPSRGHFSGSTHSCAPAAAAASSRRSAVAMFAAASSPEVICSAAIFTARTLARGALRVLRAPAEYVARERVDPVQEEDAVEVVELVQDAARLKALGVDRQPLACGRARAQADRAGAAHVCGQPRDRETALAGDLNPLRGLDPRVYQHKLPVAGGRLAVAADIDDRHPHELAKLRRRDPHASGIGAHRRAQILSDALDQLALRLPLCQLARAALEQRMGVEQHLAHGHRNSDPPRPGLRLEHVPLQLAHGDVDALLAADLAEQRLDALDAHPGGQLALDDHRIEGALRRPLQGLSAAGALRGLLLARSKLGLQVGDVDPGRCQLRGDRMDDPRVVGTVDGDDA